MKQPVFLITVMCIAEVLGMAGSVTFLALLPNFIAEWGLSNTSAGWISSIYYGGYVVAVLILVSLTDRMETRKIYLLSMFATFVGTAGFALFASGFWSATILRVLAGIGLAGTYMPGLKILNELIEEGPAQRRAVSFYTSAFGIGASLSYYLAGKITAWVDWHWAFGISSIGSLIAIVLVIILIPSVVKEKTEVRSVRLQDFVTVLRNRKSLGYMLAYGVHSWELFGLRTWIVVFFVFSNKLQQIENPFWSPTTLAAIINLVGLPSSVIGNEFSERYGRRKVVSIIMIASAMLACTLGWTATLPSIAIAVIFLIYGALVTADSSSITTGTVISAPKGYQGTTMAVHSSIGFAGAVIGPLVFGMVLDLTGGGEQMMSWGLAFGAMGAAVALGPVFLWLLVQNNSDSKEKAKN